MLSAVSKQKIDRELTKYPADQKQSAVMSALAIAQDEHGWLPNELMDDVAQYLGMPSIAVYEVATFYNMYNLQPNAKHKITVCTNLPCALSGGVDAAEYLKKKLGHASVGRITIERPAKNARITIFSARPGVVIGKKGEDIETLRSDLRKMMGGDVGLNIEEIRKPEIDAQLISDSISQQLEKRIMFRRAMKRAMQNAMRLGAQGIKIMCAGRLNGIEIARTEWYREGRVPLHTLRADIDYGFSEARTTYGVIGIKVWVFKGEVLAHNADPTAAPVPAPEAPKRPRRSSAPGVKNVAAS